MTPGGGIDPGLPGPVIQVLDEATITKIAAGEVIERPASVVKELLENAIDAGARRIFVDVVTGKREIRSIRVTDDGCGMFPADAELAFVPHATSKIRSARDLEAIHTLGFRGEALASIAAVSRVTLATKPRSAGVLAGTRVILEGSGRRETGSVGTPEGTSISVEDLFYNTPARKKFQKSLPTELAHIQRAVGNAALSHPEVAFTLTVNRQERFATPGSGDLREVLIALYGSEGTGRLGGVSGSGQDARISGYLSLPPFTQKTQGRLTLVVNGRPVYSRQVLDAIREGYGTLLPRDRYPLGVLVLSIDPDLVDVNVHPAKHQIRLTKESGILGAVADGIAGSLFPEDPDLQSGSRAAGTLIPDTGFLSPAGPASVREAAPGYSYRPGDSLVPPAPTHYGTLRTDRQLRVTEITPGSVPESLSRLPEISYIGQFNGIYILAETSAGELLVIDQHAAHERILYEQVKEHEASARQGQELLEPRIIRPRPGDSDLLREFLPDLEREGFAIEPFGGDAFLVRAVPVVLGRMEDPSLIGEVIQELLEGPVRAPLERRERIAKVVACRGALKAGTACTPEQCRRLIDQLRHAKNPFTCPHGRPTIIRFSREQLDTMFRRM